MVIEESGGVWLMSNTGAGATCDNTETLLLKASIATAGSSPMPRFAAPMVATSGRATVRQHSCNIPEPPQSLAICLQHSCSLSVIASGMKHAICGAIIHSIVKPIASARHDRDICKVYIKSLWLRSTLTSTPLGLSSAILEAGAQIPVYQFRPLRNDS